MRWVHRYAPELEKRVRWYQGYRVSGFSGLNFTQSLRMHPPFNPIKMMP
jgi:hypothetical protein